MAVHLKTKNPSLLLKKIKQAIDEKKIDTWSFDADGDFTHTPDQWKYEAWLRPRIREGELLLSILGQKTKKMSKATYGVYHGRFIEMVLTHFDSEIGSASASSMPEVEDHIG